MKLIFQISDRLVEISAEGDRLTREELKTLKEYLDIQERMTPAPAPKLLPMRVAYDPVDNNAGTNPDQTQRLQAQYRAFIKRHPRFLDDSAFLFTRLWHKGMTYKKLMQEFPGVTNTDINTIRFGLNLPRRQHDHEIKRPEKKINHAKEDTTWPGKLPSSPLLSSATDLQTGASFE